MAKTGARKAVSKVKEASRPRSRSPHPYNFSGSTVPQSNDSDIAPDVDPAGTGEPHDGFSTAPSSAYFDADHRKRPRHFDGSSESATDADDEKGNFFLSLPAPALRPRKGLKSEAGSGSPLLTPSYLDDEERTASLETKARKIAAHQSQNTDAEAAKLREKFRRRRRAEVIRRATETTLFLAVFCVGTRNWFSFFQESPAGKYSTSRLTQFWEDREHLSSLSVFGLTVSALYLLYPFRIVFQNHSLNVSKKKPWYYIHLPAAFDPAPLLYPVLLPASVACLVGRSSSTTLLPNLVLGISSVPSKIIPWGRLGWCSSLAWTLSILPLLDLRQYASPISVGNGRLNDTYSDRESLSLLFPLHQILLPILQSLTTTSLLPTELQLLSAGLINLYILSDTPQALILKAVLWTGPVGLLVLCSKLLRVGVAIARIPSWRLRRSRLPPRSTLVIVQALYDLSEMFRSNGHQRVESSDDEMGGLRARIPQVNRRLPKIQTFSLDGEPPLATLQKAPTLPVISDDLHVKPNNTERNGILNHTISRRHRSNTLPVYNSLSEDTMSLSRPGMTVRHASRLLQRASLRKMTAPQATLLRWLMALYFYMAVILLILFPIKKYVERQALNGKEPIAWALDYLFGDLPIFHDLVDQWNIRQWIPYQSHQEMTVRETVGRAEVFRGQLGLANTRLLVCAYAVTVIAGGLAIVLSLSPVADVDTRRKVFHGMMVMMFLPTSFIDPTFIGLAFALVLVIFLVLDLIRASQLPPLARPLTNFLAPYVDGRDHRGPVIVSHIFLLIGCAIPLWLSLASVSRIPTSLWDGWEVPTRDLSMVSGIICVGMGDAAASLFGRRYGRRRWCWSGGKSLEGSLAFAVAVVIGLTLARFWLLAGAWAGDSNDSFVVFWTKSLVAGCGASLTEAVLTGGNDNVIVPVILWVLVKGLGI